MKVAIIHYWLVGMRGGEKVVERLERGWQFGGKIRLGKSSRVGHRSVPQCVRSGSDVEVRLIAAGCRVAYPGGNDVGR